MDKRTRVLNAMNKLPVDHVPVAFWFHFSGEEAVGQACIDAHLKYYRETDLDFLKVMCDGYFAYPLPKISEPADLAKLKPLTADDPYVREQVERAKAIVQAIGRERCVFYNVNAPFSALRNGAAEQGIRDAQLMKFLHQDVHAVMKGLDVIAETNALIAELLITEAGCDGIYYCVQSGEPERFTPAQYHKFIEPSDLYVLEHANRFSENNILHMCGWAGKKNQLTVWQDYPAKTVNWAVHVEDLDLLEGRYFMGGRAVLGGFQTLWDQTGHTGKIYEASKEELQAYTKGIILNYGKRGLLLGGDCTIDADLDWERIKWIVEAARSI